MIEDIEDVSQTHDEGIGSSEMREIELDYIMECIQPPDPEGLIERIDDIEGGKPPKAVDSNPEIAEIIEPVRDQIPSKYLEAPTDMEQVEQISDYMRNLEGLNPKDWKNLTIEERVDLLNRVEQAAADVEHRPSCPITIEDLGEVKESNGQLVGSMGYHKSANFLGDERIVINSELVAKNSPEAFNECLDTVIHEGRHSYQTYNLENRQTHQSQGDITNWRTNLDPNEIGYQDPETYGFKDYWLQPVEADARKFSEDVLTKYKSKKG